MTERADAGPDSGDSEEGRTQSRSHGSHGRNCKAPLSLKSKRKKESRLLEVLGVVGRRGGSASRRVSNLSKRPKSEHQEVLGLKPGTATAR